MTKYGMALFSVGFERGARLQRTLIEAMNARGVITVPPADIQKWYDEDRVSPIGCSHCYVLHNKDEEDAFRTVMESEEMQDENVLWKISKSKSDREFLKWCENVDPYVVEKGDD